MHPKISIIIPIYNVEKYLKRCLDSVLNQTFQDWTAICVDDGSPDNSGKIADEYAKKDKRFIVIHKENGGVSDARNIALKKVKTEYVMYLDSDDFIHPQTLEIMYNKAVEKNVDLVIARIDKISQDAKIDTFDVFTNIDYIVTDNILKYAAERDGIKSKFAVKRMYLPGKLYKTDLIKDIVSPTDVRICEDFYWLSDCYAKLPKTLIMNIPLYYYVQNATGNVNSAKKIKFIQSVCGGIKYGVSVFKNNKRKSLYMKNIIWPFVYSVVRTIKNMDNEQDKKMAVQYLKEVYDMGVCSRPYDLQSLKYYFRIKKLLKLYS